MSGFVQTMKDWRRMCKAYTTDDDETCCADCPARHLDEHGCDAIFSEFADKVDWHEVEEIVTKWAAEHPEPVYPAWLEWLEQMGIIRVYKNSTMLGTELAIYEPIPAALAQKLGIEPKEEST